MNKDVKTLKPFTRFLMTIGQLPSSYLVSMTYEEQLLWFCNFLEKEVIPTVNNNAEAVIELQEYVKNYFDNLDVQEEINTKLDEMAEDGTLNELIGRYRDNVHIKELGCVGDGTTDNATLLQEIFDTYKNIYVDEGEYYSSVAINVPSDVTITGKGTIKGNLNIIGNIGDTVSFTTLDVNKINTTETFSINELLNVYYEDLSDNTLNRRQMVVTSSTDGKLSNNLLSYDNDYTIKRTNSINNVKIKDISVNGIIKASYAKDIIIDKVTVSGNILVEYSYNVNILNCNMHFGNENRIDVYRGSSNINIENVTTLGGNTVSDNGAIKLNEAFYSNVNNCTLGTPNRGGSYNGTFHAIMIDGSYAEDNYPNNNSQYINVNNCFVANGYSNACFITKGEHININSFSGHRLHLKYAQYININNSYFDSLFSETNNSIIKFTNSTINTINSGERKNLDFVNCQLDSITLAQATDNLRFVNCKINSITNTYTNVNSAHNILLDNCEIFTKCDLKGIQYLTGKIITHASAILQEVHNSDIDILIVDNVNSLWTNIQLQTCTNNKIYYHIIDSALATTPVNTLLTNYNNIIESVIIRKSNNPNANVTQAITKGSAAPSDEVQHFRGEIVYNYAPTAGGTVGWICVQTGTPGTWKAFGDIEN